MPGGAGLRSLTGHDDLAAASFETAERLVSGDGPFLTDVRGIAHAESLRRQGDLERARAITKANLRFCTAEGLIDNVSICYRLLGDIAADTGRHSDARAHFDKAVEIAGTIFERTVLLEALSARGRWAARWGNANDAADDLHESLIYAEAGGYRLLEIDSHVGLAWRHARIGATEDADVEVSWVETEIDRRGYAWPARETAALREMLTA